MRSLPECFPPLGFAEPCSAAPCLPVFSALERAKLKPEALRSASAAQKCSGSAAVLSGDLLSEPGGSARQEIRRVSVVFSVRAKRLVVFQPRSSAKSLPLNHRRPRPKSWGPGAFEVCPGEARFSSDCLGKSWTAAMSEQERLAMVRWAASRAGFEQSRMWMFLDGSGPKVFTVFG